MYTFITLMTLFVNLIVLPLYLNLWTMENRSNRQGLGLIEVFKIYNGQAKMERRSISVWLPHVYHAARSILLNTHCASRSVLGFVHVVDWNMWKSVALQLLAAVWPSWHCCTADRPTVQSLDLFTASCLRSKTRLKWWFSSQRRPLSTKDPAHVKHAVATRLHAKFRRHTLRRFGEDSPQMLKATLELLIRFTKIDMCQLSIMKDFNFKQAVWALCVTSSQW